MGATLYDRLGGHERIAAIIDESVDRHAVNPILASRFLGKDLPRLKQLGTRLFCAGIGGPEECAGRELHPAHYCMKLGEAEFLSAVADVVAALRGQGVAPAEVNEIVVLLHSMKNEMLRD